VTVRVVGGGFEQRIRAACARARGESARQVGPTLVRALQSSLTSEFKSVSRLRKAKLVWRVRGDGALVVRDKSKTARIFEEGGTITPKKGKYLAVAFTPFAYMGAFHDRKVKSDDGGARVGDFVFRSRTGHPVIMSQTSNLSDKRRKAWRKREGLKWGDHTPKVVPTGVLLTSVTLRRRTRFKAVAASFGPKYVAALRRYLKQG